MENYTPENAPTITNGSNQHLSYFPAINDNSQQETIKEELQPASSGKSTFKFSDLFIPRSNYWVTPALVILNIGIYLLMAIQGSNPFNFNFFELLYWGGNLQAAFSNGEYWRLLTSCFIHTGLLHLLLNLPELIYIGFILEKKIGSLRFLFAYLITGTISSLFSVSYYTNMISCGASAAILGMFGVFFPIFLSHKIVRDKSRLVLLVCTGALALSDLLSSLQLSSSSQELLQKWVGEIDNVAHWSGFITGIIIGCLYMLRLQTQTPRRLFIHSQWLGPVLLTVFVFGILHSSIGRYENALPELSLRIQLVEIEERALQEFSSDKNSSTEIQIEEFMACNRHLDTCATLVRSWLSSSLADSISKTTFTPLLEYYELRMSYNEDFIRYLRNNNALEYEFLINRKQKRLEALLQYLNGETDTIIEIPSQFSPPSPLLQP